MMVKDPIRKIQDQYFAGIPFRCACYKEYVNFIAANQEQILNSTVLHDLNKKYPLKKSHEISFLKNIIMELESSNVEVSESLYLAYINLSCSKSCDNHYVHFPLGESFITIKEKNELISSGTTGLVVWEAGKVLSNYCINHASTFRGKTILELGSGLGLCGLSAILGCQPKCFCFSDCHDEVLDYLKENILINLNRIPAVEPEKYDNDNVILDFAFNNTRVIAVKLFWQDLLSKVNRIVKPDVIFAADIVYDSSVIPSLGNLIAAWLQKDEAVEFILSCTVRNANTLTEFLSFLHALNLHETVIESAQIWNMSYNCKYDVKIFSIRVADE